MNVVREPLTPTKGDEPYDLAQGVGEQVVDSPVFIQERHSSLTFLRVRYPHPRAVVVGGCLDVPLPISGGEHVPY